MGEIEEFEKWAKQFIAIQDSHVREFLGYIGDMSLHEMKVLFSERYQEEISFSYSLQVERKGDKGTEDQVAFYYILQRKEIVKNLHVKKIEGNGGGLRNIKCRDYGYNQYSNQYSGYEVKDSDVYGDWQDEGAGEGDGQNSYGMSYGCGFSRNREHDGSGYGSFYGIEQYIE